MCVKLQKISKNKTLVCKILRRFVCRALEIIRHSFSFSGTMSRLFARLLFFIVAVSVTSVNAQRTRLTDAELAQEVHKLINEYRVGEGLPALKYDATVAAEALTHSRNMANKSVAFGHDGFEERSERLSKKLSGVGATAENVAYVGRDAERVVKMWLNSAGHKKNIIGNYNYTGIGIAESKDGTVYYRAVSCRRSGRGTAFLFNL